MNCQCNIVRHFTNGSTSTTENTGSWNYICTACGLRVMQTLVTPPSADEETEALIARGFASGRNREALKSLARWAEEE